MTRNRAARQEGDDAMDGLAVMRVTVVVVGIMHLLRWAGVPERWAPLLVTVLSALAVALWAFGQGSLNPSVLFSYVSGWVAVATSAAMVWGFTWAAGTARRSRPHHQKRSPR
jgi:hypothetical protein